MSQVSIIDIEGTHPQIPTQFDADIGFAIPIANTLEILGDTSLAGSTPVHTEGSGNTITTFVQVSQAIAATDATKIGLSAFDSSMFTVDANGFVQLAGGSVGLDSLTGDDGVVVTGDGSGNINLVGSVVPNATNPKPLYFDGDAGTFTQSLELQVSSAIAASPADTNDAGICSFDSSSFSVNSNGFVTLLGGSEAVDSFTTDDALVVLPNAAGNVNVFGLGETSTQGDVANTIGILSPRTAQFVVDPTLNNGTHQTITAALAAASSGSVIFIRPGTYTENLTLKAGVDLVAYSSDYVNGQVEIVGKLTYTVAGTVNLYNLKLTTNSDYFLEITGANNSVMNIRNCYLNVTNNTGINITCTGASREIVFDGCYGDITTTLISYFTVAGSGAGYLGQGVFFKDCHFRNSGNSTTASTVTSNIRVEKCFFMFPLSFTAAGLFARFSEFNCNNTSTTALTTATSNLLDIDTCLISSGTASAISIGAGTSVTIYNSDVSSSNTNVITGAGSIDYAGLNFTNTSSNINVTTQTLSEEGPSRSVGSSNSGGTNTLTVFNSSNTASSAASIVSSVGGTSAGDPVHQSVVSGTTTWTWGADNSVTSPTADPWVLAQGTALGTNNVMSVATSGEINYPLQPACLVYNSAQIADITGNGAVYSPIAFNTEIYDQNSDYDNTTYTFTAPVTGRCIATVGILLNGIDVTKTAQMVRITTSNRTYTHNSGSIFNSGGQNHQTMTVDCDMDAADTLVFGCSVGGAVLDVDINQGSATDLRSYGMVRLAC